MRLLASTDASPTYLRAVAARSGANSMRRLRLALPQIDGTTLDDRVRRIEAWLASWATKPEPYKARYVTRAAEELRAETTGVDLDVPRARLVASALRAAEIVRGA